MHLKHFTVKFEKKSWNSVEYIIITIDKYVMFFLLHMNSHEAL